MSPIQSMLAVLFALGAAAAQAQSQAPAQPPTGKPVDDSATYGPVLHPPQPSRPTTLQPGTASPQAAGEGRPQAQEERAGQPPVTGRQNEVDPSARPAPEPVQPLDRPSPQTAPVQPKTQQELQGGSERRQPTNKQVRRRPGALQRIEATPRIAAPAPTARAEPAAASGQAGPPSRQALGCMGSTCTDASGNTYNAGGPGNTALSSTGRLCTSNGTQIQCL